MQGGSVSVLVNGDSVGNRYLDWFRQAEADLRHARNALDDGDFEWSCFAAHQAAEKAMKAVLQKFGMDAWGHTLTALVGHLPSIDSASDSVVNCAKILDKHYIPTRYPNGFDSGAPTDFYTEEEAKKAIQCAEAIIEFCRNQIS
jgi:HEPN domain-containing protein